LVAHIRIDAMDWKNKHFAGQRQYPQARDQVLAAARGFVAETLGWPVADTPDGFEAKGASFLHAAVATFHVVPADGGSRVALELAVARAGMMGFMLFDIGGYYNGQITHWLEGISDRLEGRVGAAAPHRPPSAKARLLSWLLLIAFVGFAIWAAWAMVVAPLIGVTTGVLYLSGRSGDITLRGGWARGVSVAILLFDAFVIYRLLRPAPRRPRILGPG